MKSLRVFLMVLITILLSGCPARSVYPLFTDKDSQFNASLIGTWVNNEDSYTFEKLNEKNYRVLIRSLHENDSAVYEVRSGKIGSGWFLDSYPLYDSKKDHHDVSMHIITKMSLRGDTLTIASLEADWLLKMINEKKINVAHIKRENEVILSAPTNELQNFIGTISSSNDAFPDGSDFVRSK